MEADSVREHLSRFSDSLPLLAMADSLVGLHFAAPAFPHPQRHRGRLLPAPRFATSWRGRLHTARAAVAGPPEVDEDEDEAMSIDNLHRFFDLNVGKWDGSFYQFDAHGKILQRISTRLSASTYGEDNLISLLQSLYIKQASSAISIVDKGDSEPDWVEYKIKETNLFTVDKYQQCTYRILS